MSPAPTSRTTARATSETTKAFRSRRVPALAPSWRAPSLSESWTSGREPARAGARPQAAAVSSDTSAVKPRTGALRRTGPSPARFAGERATRSWTPQRASRRPSAPPQSASSRFSVMSCHRTCAREAPSAVRIAISRTREVPRASSRLATFAHAISRTNATAPKRTRRIGRISPAISSWIGTRRTAPARVVVRKLPRQARGDRLHLRPRLLEASRPASAARSRSCTGRAAAGSRP